MRYLNSPQNVTPGVAGSWQAVDCSAYVPGNTSGVLLRISNSVGSSRNCGLRKNGSTDTRIQKLKDGGMCWRAIGVDGAQIFEANIHNLTDLTIELMGYFLDSEAYFFTNGQALAYSGYGAWESKDITSLVVSGTAIGAIVEFYNSGGANQGIGLRKNGSTDARTTTLSSGNKAVTGMCGVDSGEVLQIYRSNVGIAAYLTGYFLASAPVVFHTNGIDRSIVSTGSWTSLASPSATASGVIYEVVSGGRQGYGFRPAGSADTTTGNAEKHAWGMPEASGNVVEGYIGKTAVDFFEVGYFLNAAGDGPAMLMGCLP